MAQPSPYTDHLATARAAADQQHVDAHRSAETALRLGHLHAAIAQVEATREQTAVLREILAFAQAEAQETAPEPHDAANCKLPDWIHDDPAGPCKTGGSLAVRTGGEG